MIRYQAVAYTLLVVLGLSLLANAEEKNKKEVSLKDVKCLFCGKDAQKENVAEYKGLKVYFGCPGCAGSFKENPKKFAAEANAQLVATKQAKQIACPLSGKKTSDKFKVTVNKTEVALCCPNCKKAVEKLESEDQLKKLFSEAAFKKGFKIPKKKKKKS